MFSGTGGKMKVSTGHMWIMHPVKPIAEKVELVRLDTESFHVHSLSLTVRLAISSPAFLTDEMRNPMRCATP
jgi:hypothetical protein